MAWPGMGWLGMASKHKVRHGLTGIHVAWQATA